MKSGLEDRNNASRAADQGLFRKCLNEVRPGRPEQFGELVSTSSFLEVSMKSGLEDRNNPQHGRTGRHCDSGLNEVRPGRPEQYTGPSPIAPKQENRLNEVRPGRPEQCVVVVFH